jgi:quercetin dioxygenase-like cupin family protein
MRIAMRTMEFRTMHKNLLSATAVVLAVLAFPSGSQVVMPEMTLHRYDSLAVNNAADGRIVRRMEGATIGLIRVEWPVGTRTTSHNHANELVVFLVEGRLKALSGDVEFILQPGDLVVVPAYVEHSYEALEDSVTVEAAGPG